MKEDNDFYQIRIFKKGLIEIFQNVWIHQVKCNHIMIKWCPTKNTGNCNVSCRSISDAYNIEIFKDPEYMPESSIPRDITVNIY